MLDFSGWFWSHGSFEEEPPNKEGQKIKGKEFLLVILKENQPLFPQEVCLLQRSGRTSKKRISAMFLRETLKVTRVTEYMVQA